MPVLGPGKLRIYMYGMELEHKMDYEWLIVSKPVTLLCHTL